MAELVPRIFSLGDLYSINLHLYVCNLVNILYKHICGYGNKEINVPACASVCLCSIPLY